MKNLHVKNLVISASMLILSGICSLGYSQKRSDAPPVSGGVKLVYIFPGNKPFKYVNDTKVVQNMDVNDQSMLVNISMIMGCEVKPAVKQGENLKLEIKIDTMAQSIESPQGNSGGPINEVKGKSFNLIISPTGKSIDLSEASKVVYNVEGSGESNLGQTFLSYFPTLPTGIVKPGDTWVSNDTLDSKSPTTTVWMPVESKYKFEGIENIDGIECAKISAALSGTRKMTTQSQGMNISTNGPFTGTTVILFAIKDGYLVKESVTSKMTGKIEIPEQNMSFPVVMDITSVNQIVK
ncbi:MAG TPA: hypothetical protein VF346_12135 [Bacteroidales bacterium]